MVRCLTTRLLFLLLLFSPLNLIAEKLDQSYLDDTVLIRRTVDLNHESTGSGFLVFCDVTGTEGRNNGTHQYKILLVTNKHILPSENSTYHDVTLRIAVRESGKAAAKNVTVTILTPEGRFMPNVAMNPNPQVDVAAVDITTALMKENSDLIARALEKHTVVARQLLLPSKDFAEADIGIGTEVYLLGYPDGIVDPRNVSPIVRMGVIASEPTENYSFDADKSAAFNLPSPIPGFLIDANVYPGSSGSMVIRRTNIVSGFSPGGKMSTGYILGIVADSIPMQDLWGVERMGLGVVFNSDTILETIDILASGSTAR